MSKKIIYNVSSYNRLKNLEYTVESVYDQCDELNVVLNNYKSVPNFLKKKKINIFEKNNEKGDAYKFLKLSESNGYFFTIDDDIIYPNNYSEYLISKIEKYNRKSIITLHGRSFSDFPISSYYKNKTKNLNFFYEKQNNDELVQFGGTGVMAFHTDLFKLNLDYFEHPNMADIWIGKFAKENNINIISISRPKNYVIQIENEETISKNNRNSDRLQTKIVNEIFTQPKISVIIPTYKNTSYIDECLKSVIESAKGINIEILVGIDKCDDTLNHIKNNKYDFRIRFMFFQKNNGPYVIKNTLSKLAKSNILLFFDSDDVMCNNMITEMYSLHKNYDMVKPKYVDFIKSIENRETKVKHGEGVFSIDKNYFLNLNGFEPWRCAADSDFMGRLYKSNIRFTYSKEISFYRRVHSESLTQKSETNFTSKLRKIYVRKSKEKKGELKLKNLAVEKFIEILPNSFIFKEIDKNKKIIKNEESVEIPVPVIIPSPIEKLKGILRGDKPKGVDYEKINDTLKQQGIYNPNKIKEKPKIKQNNPIDRNKLIEIKKGSVTDSLRTNLPNKPNRRKDVPNIFSKKNKK